MKKLFAILLVLILAMCAAAFAEEEEEEWVPFPELHPEAKAFESYWVSGDAQVRINAFCRDDCFEMIIVEMTGEDTFNSWEYIMNYDDETGRLVCDGVGLKSVNRIVDDEIAEFHNEYEDGYATFFLNEDGNLCWDDAMEPTFQATTFQKIGYFPDFYEVNETMMEVRYAGEETIYDIRIDRPESENQSWSWSLSGRFDPESGTLPVNGFKLLYTYKEDGELDLDADQKEAEVNAVLSLDADDNLVCSSDDGSLDGLVFIRTWTDLMWKWEF